MYTKVIGLLIGMVILTVSLFLSAAIPVALADKALLNQPESIVFDSLHNRYLVSNWGSGSIVQIDSNGVQSYFVTSQGCQAGLEIVGNNVYVGCNTLGVKGYNLHNGLLIMDVVILGSLSLNDVTSDTSGNIYVTDVDGHKIFKIRLSDHSYSTFVSSGIVKPNGILFDKQQNRLLVVSTHADSPIQAVSLEDSTVSVVKTTTLDDLDGLTRDSYGNWYVSSWGTRSIYRFDPDFSGSPMFVYRNSGGPADLYFDQVHDSVAFALLWANKVEYLSEEEIQDPDSDSILTRNDNCPNKFNPAQTDIDYDGVGDSCDNCLEVYNPGQEDNDYDGTGDACDFVCGDADASGGVDISDAVYLIAYIFASGPAPNPLLSGDADCSQSVDISDAVYLIAYIFTGGPAPCAECP